MKHSSTSLLLALPFIQYYFKDQTAPLTSYLMPEQLKNQVAPKAGKPLPGWVRISSPDPLVIHSKQPFPVNSTQCLPAEPVESVAPGHVPAWQCFNSKGSHHQSVVDVPVSQLSDTALSTTAYQVIQMRYTPVTESGIYADDLLPGHRTDEIKRTIQDAQEYEQQVQKTVEDISGMFRVSADPYSGSARLKGAKDDDLAIRLKLFTKKERRWQDIHADILFKLTNGLSREEEKEFQDSLDNIMSGDRLTRRVFEDDDGFYLYPDTTLQVSRDSYSHLIHYLNQPSSGSGSQTTTTAPATESQSTPASDAATPSAGEALSVSGPDNTRGVTGSLRTRFYGYNAYDGTHLKSFNSVTAVTVATVTGAGLAAVFADAIAKKADETGNRLISEAGKYPVACGAIAAGVLACVGIRELHASLKPIAETSVRGLMHQARTSLRKAHTNQLEYGKSLKQLNADLRRRLPAVEKEKESFLQCAKKIYEDEKKQYEKEFDKSSKLLTAFLGGMAIFKVSSPRPSGSDDTHQNTRDNSNTFAMNSCVAFAEYTKFVTNMDSSLFSRERLCAALRPLLNQKERTIVRSILAEFPHPPRLTIPTGKLEYEFNSIQFRRHQTQFKLDQASEQIRKIQERHPGFAFDDNGNLASPSLNEFWYNLPE